MSIMQQNPPMIESEKEKEMETDATAVFATRSKMARSPPGQRSAVLPTTRARTSQAPETQSCSALRELGREIASLVEMLEDGKRRSIHQPMRDSIESIRALYELVAIQLHDDKAKATIRTHQSCQTSPLFRTVVKAKRKDAQYEEENCRPQEEVTEAKGSE